MKSYKNTLVPSVLVAALLGLAAALPSQAAEIALPDLTQTPTADATQQNDVSTPNGGNLNNTNDSVTYYVTTFTFGASSQAHIETFFEVSNGADRLGVRVQDTGFVDFLSEGDPGNTTFDIDPLGGGLQTGEMAGQTVTLITRDYRENGNWLLRFPNAGAGATSLMNVWVNPDFSATYTAVSPGAADMPNDGDLHVLWNSNSYFYLTQRIRNEGTPGGAGDNTITDTTVLTGAEATFPRALEYALEGGPTAPGVVSAYISTVSASPVLVPNNGSTASSITVTLTDSAGTPVSGKQVSLASDGDAVITTPGSNISDASGVVTFEVTSSTDSVQEFTATNVTDSNMVLYQKTSVTFEPVGTIDPDLSTVEASSPDVPADGSTTSTITVTLRNSLGDPVSGKDVALSSDGDATITPAGTDTTDVNGEATFTVQTATQGTQIFTAADVTGTPPPASIPITQTVQVVFTEVSPTPAILFHEPFDFADGSDLNGQGGWTAGTNTAGAFVEVHDGAGAEPWDGAFTNVTQSGNYAGRSFTPNTIADWVYGGNALAPSVTATFTDGAVTWLSFIQYGNNAQVAIGADVLQQRGNVAAGQNIGMGGLFNNAAVRAHYWDDEDSNGSFEDHPSLTTIGSSNPHFVIARIVWSDTGVDSITCARFTSGSTITEAEFNAASQSTISADLDQSTFDTVSFAGSQYYIDEIRIATTFDQAVNGTLSSGTPFEAWAPSAPDNLFGDDKNGDGVSNGLAFLLGAANATDDATGLLPTSSVDGSGGLVMTFTMLDSASRGTAALSVQHSSDLGITDAWAPVTPDPLALVPDTTSTVGGVSFAVSGSGTLSVVATIPSSGNASGGKLFGRLEGTEN